MTNTATTFKLPADDLDALDYTESFPTGGPQSNNPKILVRTIKLRGTTLAGNDTTVTVVDQSELSSNFVVIPKFFAAGDGHVLLGLCDYRQTDAQDRHWGRCAQTYDIPIHFTTGATPAELPTGVLPTSPQSTQRPGSPMADGRRKTP